MDRPIGYWLKEVDRLIDADFTRQLAGEGLTRRHWQVLNVLATGVAGQDELDRALAPFLTGAEPSTAPVLAELAGRGWVTGHTLTDAGRAAHTAVADRVRAGRLRLTEGISAEEYATAVAVLERMAANATEG
ncbi:MarR family transcriptional regulator [Actinophytocola sp.]|jgi:hypothetical protein|uniref:MarR family winged helix-turn-helix transcriptional regulator n=1 Tax=Actinophytocola sp. TaxID=1872138 RepID=UPI002D7F93CD|nr:MarR family transcriptional regulator [Actinophytocola sp.]HET9142137.1 MarR family transcriptional regulator [Actinophytocola sp.]